VDRTACIWLIRRRIDPGAEFRFFSDISEAPEGEELFEVAGARLSHRGDACSFEIVLEEYELGAPVLREISERVHDAEVLTAHTDAIFDGLYAYLRRGTL
jgi:hypothetical protein